MKDLAYRFWNTIKIPLILMVISSIALIVDELTLNGDIGVIFTWEFWQGSLVALMLMTLPAVSATLDKYLREQGVYIEQVLRGFKKP